MKKLKFVLLGVAIFLMTTGLSSCVYHAHHPDYGYRHRPDRVIIRHAPPRVAHRHHGKRDYKKYEKRYDKRHQSRYGYRNGPR